MLFEEKSDYESILRALRHSDTPEGYAVAALLKRGNVKLVLKESHPSGLGGLYRFGTNYVTIYTSVCRTPQNAAGYVAHEVRHYLQNLTPDVYRKVHEFEAYFWQKLVDRSFPYRTEEEIWSFINSCPEYASLK